jgi:hypothetical protein
MARGGGFPFCLEAEGREASPARRRRGDATVAGRPSACGTDELFLSFDMGTEEWVSEEFLN